MWMDVLLAQVLTTMTIKQLLLARRQTLIGIHLMLAQTVLWSLITLVLLLEVHRTVIFGILVATIVHQLVVMP